MKGLIKFFKEFGLTLSTLLLAGAFSVAAILVIIFAYNINTVRILAILAGISFVFSVVYGLSYQD